MKQLEQIQSELFRQIDAQCDLTVGQVVPITEAIEKALYSAYTLGIKQLNIELTKSTEQLTKETK